jgi:HPt (histidine-containing phosphotransfer) domain-containing protein
MTVINMFRDQSPILLEGAINENNDQEIRAQSLHALKGMALQLGLIDLTNQCQTAEHAITASESLEELQDLLSSVRSALSIAQSALNGEATRLMHS